MAGAKTFDVKVVVSAVDNATAQFKEINKKIANSPLSKLNKSFSKLSVATGMPQVAKAFSNVKAAAGDVMNEVGALAAKIGALGALGGAGLFGLAKNFGDFADQVNDGAERLGISTDAFQTWSGAAKLAGVDTETFSTSVDRFSKNMGEAALGTGDAAKVFSAMGVAVKDQLTGRLLSLEEVMPKAIEKLNSIKSAQARAAFGAKLFGKQFGTLVPLIKDWNEKTGIAKGFIIKDDEISRGDKFIDKLNEIKLVFGKLALMAGGELLDGFLVGFEELKNLINTNKEAIKEMFKAIGNALPKVIQGIASLVRSFAEFFTMKDEFGKVVLNFDRIKQVLALIAAISVAPLVASIISLMGSLWTFGSTLWGFFSTVSTFFGSLSGASVLLTLFEGIGAVIGALLTPIGAVIAAAVALYAYWKPFRDLVNSVVGIVWSLIKAMGRLIWWTGAIQLLIAPFKVLLDVLGWIWEKLVAIGSYIGGKLGSALSKVAEWTNAGSAKLDTMVQGPTVADQFVNMLGSAQNSKQEAAVTVNFENAPKGTRVTTDNPDSLDLAVNRGWSMVPN